MNIRETIPALLKGKVVVSTEDLMGEKLYLKIGKDDRLYTTLDRIDPDGDARGFLQWQDLIYEWEVLEG